MGIQIKESLHINTEEEAIVVCSLGDASMTEGEVSEALQMAALKQLPIIYLVQDNGWDISATAKETRAMDAYQYAQGFTGIEAIKIDGSDFVIKTYFMGRCQPVTTQMWLDISVFLKASRRVAPRYFLQSSVSSLRRRFLALSTR